MSSTAMVMKAEQGDRTAVLMSSQQLQSPAQCQSANVIVQHWKVVMNGLQLMASRGGRADFLYGYGCWEVNHASVAGHTPQNMDNKIQVNIKIYCILYMTL